VSTLSDVKVLWIVGLTLRYPKADFANADYSAATVTSTNTEAVNFNASLTLLQWFTFCSLDGEQGIAPVEIYNVKDNTVAWQFNYDEEPNVNPSDPTAISGSKPRTMDLRGIAPLFAHGIGMRCQSATGRLMVAYKDIIP
jgi:hypothetical protein